eukprot:11212884-Lingulodinium_polyedra.AAC.1
MLSLLRRWRSRTAGPGLPNAIAGDASSSAPVDHLPFWRQKDSGPSVSGQVFGLEGNSADSGR